MTQMKNSSSRGVRGSETGPDPNILIHLPICKRLGSSLCLNIIVLTYFLLFCRKIAIPQQLSCTFSLTLGTECFSLHAFVSKHLIF